MLLGEEGGYEDVTVQMLRKKVVYLGQISE